MLKDENKIKNKKNLASEPHTNQTETNHKVQFSTNQMLNKIEIKKILIK
jgi:hypothetical protein